MSSNLNIDLLFKKYSQYFATSQTTTTQRQLQDKPFAKIKTKIPEKDLVKRDNVKLKATKPEKLKSKTTLKQSLTDTKKTKTTASTKTTPRPHITNKLNNNKSIKTNPKKQKSVTPERPRQSVSRASIGLFKKNAEKDILNPKTTRIQKHSQSRSRQFPSLTDRSTKVKTQRSKSRQTAKRKHNIYQKIRNIEIKGNKRLENAVHLTMRTEYHFQRQNLQDVFNIDQSSWLRNVPQRQKLRNQEIFGNEQYQTPAKQDARELKECDDDMLKTPLLQQNVYRMASQEIQDQQKPNKSSTIQQYYKQEIEKLKQEQESKWKRAILILKQFKEVGNKQMIDKLIDESEQNRMSLHNQDKFQRYKSLYNEDSIKQKSYTSQKDKVETIRSRQASNQRLLQDLQKSQYHQMQLELHFSNNKDQKMIGSSNFQNVNIQEYLLSQSKKQGDTPSKQLDFDMIQINQPKQSQGSGEVSLIQFIQNQLKQSKKQHKDKTNQKINPLVQTVLQNQMQQFGKQMMNNNQILHSFLKVRSLKQEKEEQFGNLEKQPQGDLLQHIECGNEFILQLTRYFLEYIQKQGLADFKRAICVPFGEKPEKMLKFMRQTDQNRQDNENGYQSIVSVNLFIQFQPLLKEKIRMSGTIEQYFFNHCIFDCLNQNLDKLRPFGLKGLPPLCFKTLFLPPSFATIYDYTLSSIKNILSFGIGRQIDEVQEENAFQIIDTTFRRLDKLILIETDIQWKDNNDLQFQLKYDISLAVIDWIFKEQTKLLRNLIF